MLKRQTVTEYLDQVAGQVPPEFAAAIQRGNFITSWEARLAKLNACVPATPEEIHEHAGYRVALEHCISDVCQLLGREVGAPELPKPPAAWRCVGPDTYNNGLRYLRRWNGQTVQALLTVNLQLDGRRWAHLSASRRDRCLTWSEMAEIKRDFLGDLGAIQVLPPQDQHINLHGNCLHWWCPLDVWPLPDFALGGGSI